MTVSSLTKRSEILAVKRSNRRASSSTIVLQVLCNGDCKYLDSIPCRLGVVLIVSKRSGIAVVRNRVKRIIRAALSDLLSRQLLPPLLEGARIAIVGRTRASGAKFGDVKRDLLYCMNLIVKNNKH